jgi:hypothetical protein
MVVVCSRVDGMSVPCGFSAEAWGVLQKKPLAKYLDATAGNRVMWRFHGYDSQYWVYVDKEPGLLRPPDLLCEWRGVPRHFPADFFLCGLFDPPHTWFSPNSLHNNPRSYDEDGVYKGMWWGNGGSRRGLIRDILVGQRALSVVTPVLLMKWNETSIPLENILSVMTEWREVRRFKVDSPYKRGKSDTWWVKLIRR